MLASTAYPTTAVRLVSRPRRILLTGYHTRFPSRLISSVTLRIPARHMFWICQKLKGPLSLPPCESNKGFSLPSLDVQFHHRMNFPDSVVRHVSATVALIFRCMAYVPVRFPNNCNHRRLTEAQLLRSASVKRKPCGSPTKNGCANLTPLRFCRYFTDNDAGLVTSCIVQRNM
jgi:hypothetical protein